MAERDPYATCVAGCGAQCASWVPELQATTIKVRRDPLLDAMRRTEDPCARPARCPPCCKPIPKSTIPREKPECNINCYRKEQEEARFKEYVEKTRGCPQQIPGIPMNVFFKKEVPCRSNFILGFFNPDDNLPPSERNRKACDSCYENCSPEFPPFRCRGTIRYPPEDFIQSGRIPIGCQKTPYLTSAYRDRQIQKRLDLEEKKAREEYRKCLELNPPSIFPKKYSESSCCPTGCSNI